MHASLANFIFATSEVKYIWYLIFLSLIRFLPLTSLRKQIRENFQNDLDKPVCKYLFFTSQ